MNKKNILLLIVAFISMQFIFSEPVFYSKEYNISSCSGYKFGFQRGSKAIIPDTVTKFTVLNNTFESSIGFSGNAGQFDFTARTIYWPLFKDKLNIGAGLTYHCISFYDCFLENDFLYGFFIKYKTDIKIVLEANVNYFQKYSVIYSIQNKTPYLLHHNMAAQMKISYLLFNKFNFQLSLGSYSYFNYKLFYTAIFSFEADWNFHNQFWLCCENNIQYVDFFVITSNWDYFNTRLCLKVEL